jgi:hypothetical protein
MVETGQDSAVMRFRLASFGTNLDTNFETQAGSVCVSSVRWRIFRALDQ